MDVKRLIFQPDTGRGLAKLLYLPEEGDECVLGKEGCLLLFMQGQKSQLNRAMNGTGRRCMCRDVRLPKAL